MAMAETEPPCAKASGLDYGGMMVSRIMSLLIVMSALLAAAACVAQAPQPQVVPFRVGGVDVAFGLEADEVGVVPPTEGASAYVQAVLGKNMRYSQCFFVLDGAYRKKLLSGRSTSETEDRQGLHSMIVVTTQPCDTAFIRASRDASVASTKDKGALAAHFKEVQAQAVKDGGANVKLLNVSPEQASKQVGQAGLISESADTSPSVSVRIMASSSALSSAPSLVWSSSPSGPT